MPTLTHLDPESACYPSGGFLRRGRAIVTRNPHNPIALPYGEIRSVHASIPDTYFSLPARMKANGKTVRGYLTTDDGREWCFQPEADPERCEVCAPGYGCRQ